MSASQRQSIENGVWLCQTHAKIIDDDETRFTVGLLRGWRRRAELIASYAMDGRSRYDDEDEVEGATRWRWRDTVIESHDLVDGRLIVSHSTSFEYGSAQQLHRRVYEFLRDVGVTTGWGNVGAELVRLLAYEIALNAFRHGGSSEITLSSAASSVCVSHSGARFGLHDLERSEGRGGKAAVDAFRESARGAFALSYRWHQEVNEWYISDLVDDAGVSNPCGIQLDEARRDLVSEATADRLSGCDEIHIYPPEFFSFSDAAFLSEEVLVALPDRPLVIHGVDPESPVGRYVLEKMPGITFVW
jgi:hypothetical protein